MGQHQTLPADQPGPPRPRQQAGRAGGGACDLDQPQPAPPAPAERLRYRGIPLDGTTEQLHRAVDRLQADTVPHS